MQYSEEVGQLEGDDACRRSGFAGDQPGRVLSQKQGKDESRECLCHSSRDCSLNTKMDSREKLEEGKKVGGGRSPSGSWLQQQPAAARRTEDSMAFPIVFFFSCPVEIPRGEGAIQDPHVEKRDDYGGGSERIWRVLRWFQEYWEDVRGIKLDSKHSAFQREIRFELQPGRKIGPNKMDIPLIVLWAWLDGGIEEQLCHDLDLDLEQDSNALACVFVDNQDLLQPFVFS